MTVVPVLFFRLLANQKLKPGAVEIHLGKGDIGTLSPLIAENRFSAFVAAFPCFIGAPTATQSPPEFLEALRNIGCQIAEQSPYRSDESTKPLVPPHVQWLTGDWYLASPTKISGNQATSRSLSLKLLQLVAADADTCEIERIFRQDPVLAYHLLRLVNSLGIGVGKHISSFSQAILILGRQQLKRWLNLMLFAANRDDYRSPMLIARAAIRARSMELLAKASGLDRSIQEQAFMAGMFSLLGILFGIPLSEILVPLKLNHSLMEAVLYHEGELGHLLHAVEKAEHSDEAGLTERLASSNLSVADFNSCNLEAHGWMLNIIHDKSDHVDD